jgi:hypothetical protein
LNKIRIEEETGRRVKTCFLSLSSIFEWTLHKTGQKWRNSKEDGGIYALAIVDVRILHQNAGTKLLRVSNILEFLRKKD